MSRSSNVFCNSLYQSEYLIVSLILFFAKLDDFACLAKFIFCVISGNHSRTAKIISIILRKLSLFHDFSNLKSRAKTSILKEGAQIDGVVKFYDDSQIAQHKAFTDMIHRNGSLVMLQTAMTDGPIDELSENQIQVIVETFGNAAARAQKAGYDGVQIHAAHFFYLSKFISPLTNHRTDRYGGSQENRTRILYEILKSMRKKTGKDFVITMKINSSDFYQGGLSVQDFVQTCRLM